MNRLFVLLLITGLLFAPTLKMGETMVLGAPNPEDVMHADDIIEKQCFPVEALQDAAYMRDLCEELSGKDCECGLIDDGVSCNVDGGLDYKVICDDSGCYVNFMGIKNELDIDTIEPFSADFLCDSLFNVDCNCRGYPNNVYCEVPIRKISITCEGHNCILNLGKTSSTVPICGWNDGEKPEIIGELPAMEIRSDDWVISLKDDENYPSRLEISSDKDRGFRAQVYLNNVPREIRMRVKTMNEINESLRSKIKERLPPHLAKKKFKFLKVIQLDHPDLRNGEDIVNAKLTFRVPKEEIEDPNAVVIVRITENDEVKTYIPAYTEEDGYYLFKITTEGLSLYAIATVEQISEQEDNSITDGASKGCFAAGLILLSTLALYTKVKN